MYRTPVKPPDELPVLSNRAIVWAAVVLLVLGVGLVAGLLVAFGDGQNAGQLDAINLDLTGALLGPANLIGPSIVAADFTGATFTGDVWFDRAHFGLNAVFTGVRFAGETSFSSARFDHSALSTA